ncbi:MAG TPA: 4-hydroxy-3-methylbut-2-enyl diphosphate reductase [bacterium]|nr:4-hydroxy-3-methylbut-2-enyl diphosphate reductase [bacterium]
MKVAIAGGSGFCFGVQRAMDMAFKYADENKEVYSLGEIIHNPQEVRRLSEAGAKHVERISDIKKGSNAIISTHGITPERETRLKKLCRGVLDTTCPYVKIIHQIVRKLSEAGYKTVIVGDRKHLEVRGILGHAGKNSVVIEDEKDLKNARFSGKIGIVSQTTQNFSAYRSITCAIIDKVLKTRHAEVRVYNTICDATQNRQDAAVALARKSDVMVVVGGKNSANTLRLAELSRRELKHVYHVESAEEIKPSWFKGKKRAGIAAGASTPARIIMSVVNRIKKIGEK